MSFFASINGQIFSRDEARVSAFDNGLTFGDGVYETLRTYDHRPFRLGQHIARLRVSAQRIGIDIPQDTAELTRWATALVDHARHDDSFIRIIATRGVGDVSYHFERIQGPTIVMIVRPFEPIPEHLYKEGAPVVVVSVRRNHPSALDPAIKSCNLLNNILAVREAQARGAAEAIMLNDRGEVAEGASSNVFIVRDGVLLTPPLDAGILPGITRALVLAQAPQAGLATRETTLRVEDLLAADEAFITSSLREVMPVRSVNGEAIGKVRPGPCTLKLRARYRAGIDDFCRGA